jgi:hypothetical protein
VPENDGRGNADKALAGLWARWMQHAIPRIRSAVLATRPLQPFAHKDEAVFTHMLPQPRPGVPHVRVRTLDPARRYYPLVPAVAPPARLAAASRGPSAASDRRRRRGHRCACDTIACVQPAGLLMDAREPASLACGRG